MPPLGFESEIPAIEGPQTHALDRASTGIDVKGTVTFIHLSLLYLSIKLCFFLFSVAVIWTAQTECFEGAPQKFKR
jgi:hypothetical protein